MTRNERRTLNQLADDLRDCSDDLGARLRKPRLWESAGFVRAMSSLMIFGVATVNRELGMDRPTLADFAD